ncbi:molybdopterin synthase sulfur carrier subunit [Mycolicibacterium duvalii]|uniref:Molybdopterin synthase sulfur carrier subunit n=1 Tax=Mycolicibacterium duvalii TaxID=39688 RepID=A0A7I7K8A5_9MYCO|nr:MoaD/ThiS family protein [Mycolicibacterium duvalii]MCV7366446.1 MoaD/ThiS family protein [Mycolicibacterium duvalii]PEG43767.1 molybdopterin synthase sulfur carrier subunit [Mycolicibacterium duvalii]BBX20273.1 molybdopterin synthase sulfur carrier subunit [Mycolicibacterium duvalii]
MRSEVSVLVTVRYFAAARAAAGTESEHVQVDSGSTMADLVAQLSARDERLGTVLRRCSYLLDGVAVRAMSTELAAGQTVDVLPPFAGG